METTAAAATLDWTAILCSWGPSVGGVVVALALVLVPLVIYVARSNAAAQREAARLTGRGMVQVGDAVDRLADAQHASARQIGTLRQAIQSGPAEYALQKLRLMDGGYSPEEREGLRRQVEAARAAGWVAVAMVVGREWDGANKPGRWLPGLYQPSTEVVDRVRWEIGPDAAKTRVTP